MSPYAVNESQASQSNDVSVNETREEAFPAIRHLFAAIRHLFAAIRHLFAAIRALILVTGNPTGLVADQR
jgi:hypothetical protein